MGELGGGRSKWRRWKRAAILLLLLGLAILLSAWLFVRSTTRARLRAAIAEANRLDPGWRLEDLLARRTKLRDDENAAIRVKAVCDRLPAQWPSTTLGAGIPPVSFDEEGEIVPPPPPGPPRGSELLEELIALAPSMPLDARLRAGLHAELSTFGPAIALARPLSSMRQGRFDRPVIRGVLDLPMDQIMQVRRVGRLLQFDSIARADAGDLDGGLESCRAILGAGRALGDDPLMISQLVRRAIQQTAFVAFGRCLAQGEASDAALATIQEDFADEAAQPLLLIAARGERAFGFGTYAQLIEDRTRVTGGSGLLAGPTNRVAEMAEWISPRDYLTYNRAVGLELANRAVEIAKRPPQEHVDLWPRWVHSGRPTGWLSEQLTVSAYSVTGAYEAGAMAALNKTTLLGVAVMMAALERARRELGRWPDSAEGLAKFLPGGLPLDPYAGKPIRFRRHEGSLAVFSVGVNREDDGGIFDPKFRNEPGMDLGGFLWDVDRRRPPPPALAPGATQAP